MGRRTASREIPEPKTEALALRVTADELTLICSALDSHIYWELSDEDYRDSGFVADPGSDDEGAAAEIREAQALQERLAAIGREGR